MPGDESNYIYETLERHHQSVIARFDNTDRRLDEIDRKREATDIVLNDVRRELATINGQNHGERIKVLEAGALLSAQNNASLPDSVKKLEERQSHMNDEWQQFKGSQATAKWVWGAIASIPGLLSFLAVIIKSLMGS